MNLEIICWNVRGLNQRARRDTVRETISSTLCHIACLQETKLCNIDYFTASYLGGSRLDSHSYKPAGGPNGTRGGILLLWNSSHVALTNIVIGTFHITATVAMQETENTFTLTVVYGPTRHSEKPQFLIEIQA